MAITGPSRRLSVAPSAPRPAAARGVDFLARHGRRMLLFMLSVMVAVVLMTALTPPVYRSEARLFVRVDRLAASPTGKPGREAAERAIVSRFDGDVDTVVALLQSRSLIERIVDEMGPRVVLGEEPYGAVISLVLPLDMPPTREELARAREAWDADGRGSGLVKEAGGPALSWPHSLTVRWREWLPCQDEACVRERAIQHLIEHLTVEAIGRSTVVQVTYQASSPDLAQAVVQRVTERFRTQHTAPGPADDTVARLESEANELWQRLEMVEQRRREAPDVEAAASLENQRSIAVARAASLEGNVMDVEAQLEASRARVQALAARLDELPRTIEPEQRGEAGAALENLRQQVSRLRAREVELLARYTDEVSLVQEVRRQIAEAEAMLAREEAGRKDANARANPAYAEANQALQQARTEQAALEAWAVALRRQLGETRASLGRLGDQRRQAEAGRDLELLETTRERFADLLAQIRGSRASDPDGETRVEVVQSASLEVRAIGPRKTALVGLGFFLAVLGALALGFLTDRVDPQPI